jgi:HEPN domain-containing protein
MSSFNFLNIQENKTPIKFLLAWHAAREHYVVARVSLQQGITYSGCLLAEQSVEMFVKAILHLDNNSKIARSLGHDLLKLLEYGRLKVKYFDILLTEPKLEYFIRNLAPVYFKMRFGEVGFSIKNDELIQVLDEVAFNLNNSYRESANPHIRQRARVSIKNSVKNASYEAQECPLYVPDALKEEFLRNNRYFSEKDVSNNMMASIPLP